MFRPPAPFAVLALLPMVTIPRRRLALLTVIVPLALALHVYLVWLGGAWRVFALVEAGVGTFVALAMREARRLDEPK